jgi:hypothetical protein
MLRRAKQPGRPGGLEGVHRVPPLYSITLKLVFACIRSRVGPVVERGYIEYPLSIPLP